MFLLAFFSFSHSQHTYEKIHLSSSRTNLEKHWSIVGNSSDLDWERWNSSRLCNCCCKQRFVCVPPAPRSSKCRCWTWKAEEEERWNSEVSVLILSCVFHIHFLQFRPVRVPLLYGISNMISSYAQAATCAVTENGRLWLPREGSTECAGRGHEEAHRPIGTTGGHQWSWEEVRCKLSLWPLFQRCYAYTGVDPTFFFGSKSSVMYLYTQVSNWWLRSKLQLHFPACIPQIEIAVV